MDQLARSAKIRTLDDLPSPPGIPLLGNALQLDLKRMHQILEAWCREFGVAYKISLGPKKVFVCADAELLQTALHERPETYRRFSPVESVLAEIGGNGLFSSEGKAWLPQRRLVMQALAPTNFRDFFPALQTITERLERRWRRAADTGLVLEMPKELVRYTVDVTTTLAFGEDPNTIEESGDVIQNHLARIFPMIMSRVNAPFPYWRYFKMSKDRELDQSLVAVHGHIAGLIERARKRRRDQPSEIRHNLLEAMLAASEQADSGITDDIISANVMTLLLAGEDTTAHALAWTMLFLCTEPGMQARMHEASAEVLGAARVCPTFDDLERLALFEALTQEATRLKPIIPVLLMEPVVDVVLDDVALPAGTPIFFLLRPAMLDEKHFGKPQAFLPERWAEGHHQVQPHDGHAYMQFGAGPRVCPGRHLAGVEMRLVLSMLCRNFSMELTVDPQSIQEVPAFTMMPSAMPVRLRTVGL
jgi:cytochrome P450